MYASSKNLTIDRTQAIAQLTALGYKNGQRVYLRFFFPTGDPRKDGDKGRNLEGKFPNLPWFLMEKFQAEGRGCYFVVNGGGHNDASVTQCKALFCEHDNLPKDLQRDLWRKRGLPEPTVQVDSGGRSIHTFFKLDKPCLPEQWRELQEDVLEFVDGDRTLKNPSRVMRLAGAYYFKPGHEPVQSTLILNTSKSYSSEELRAIIPKQKKKQDSEPTEIRWYEFEKNFQLPIDDQVPLYECLTKTDRDLIDRGAAQGERNDRGYALAANLIATTDYLSSIGQHYEGDPQQFFDQYCHNCTPPIDSGEAEAIWRSANQRTKSASLPPHLIANCVKGWKWRQLQGEKQQQSEQQKQFTSISDRRSRKVVSLPSANRETLNTDELKGKIDALIAEDLPQSELEAIIPDLAHLANRQTRDVRGLYRARLTEIDKAEERETLKKALPSLLEVKKQKLNPYEYLWSDNGKLAKQLVETAAAMPTAVEFLITTLIPVCGSLIGTSARIVIKASSRYVQPAVYRTCVVAPSGFKKTPAQLIIIDPLDELNSEEYRLWMEAQEQYKADKQQYDHCAKSKRKDDDVDDPPKEPQPRKQYIASDTTYEALIKIHSENPQGLLHYRDEWSANITARNKYRNGSGDDAQNELSEFNGKSLSKNRMKESLFLERTAISRTGSTQPETLKRHMGDHTDFSGEFGRWLFCAAECPLPYADLLSPDAGIDIGISQNLRSLYKSLLQLPKGDYFLADDAKAIFQTYQHHLVDWTFEETQQGLKTAYPKFETYFVRLILWLHVVNGILAGETPQELITGKTVSKAASLTDYFIGQLRLIYAHNSPDDHLKGRLLDIKQCIDGKPDGVTPREIKAKNWKFRKIPTVEIAQDCKTLESSGYIYSKDGRYYSLGDGGEDDDTTPHPNPPNKDLDNSPSNGGIDVVHESSTPTCTLEPPIDQELPQSDSESVDVVDVLLMNPQHPQHHTGKGVEPFVDVVDENSNDIHDSNETTPHQHLEVTTQPTFVVESLKTPQQHQQNAEILTVSRVEGVDESSTKPQQHQHPLATEPTVSTILEPGDFTRDEAVQQSALMLIELADTITSYALLTDVIKGWKSDYQLEVLQLLPDELRHKFALLYSASIDENSGDDSKNGGNQPVAPLPKPSDDGGGSVIETPTLEPRPHNSIEETRSSTASTKSLGVVQVLDSQQMRLDLPQTELPAVEVHLPDGVDWLDPESPKYQEQCQAIMAAPLISLDIETYQADQPKKHVTPKALHPWQSRIRLIQLCTGEQTLLLDIGDRNSDFAKILESQKSTIDLLREVIQNPDQRIVGHNIHFDLRFLATKLGIRNAKNVVCTRVGAQVYYGDYGKLEGQASNSNHEPILVGGYSLANLAHRLLDTSLDKREQKSDWGAVLTSEQIKYAVQDPLTTLQVYHKLEALYIDKILPLYYEGLRDCWQLECDAIPCAIEIEMAGMPLDVDAAKQQLDMIAQHRTALLEDWAKLCPHLKYTQRDKLLKHLNKEHQLGLVKMDKGSLDKKTRENPIIQIKLKLQGLDSLTHNLKGFLASAARDGRVHTTYKTLTGTGRFSSGGGAADLPNLQAIKAKSNPILDDLNLSSVREVIRPRPGRTMAVVDLAGAHGRIAASETQDVTAIAGNNDPSIDNHLKVAVFVAKSQGLDWTAEYMGKVRKDPTNPDSSKAKLFREALPYLG